MRELAVQSANDTNTTDDRASLNAEFSQLISEVDRIAKTTSFNGKVLLDGGFSGAANAAVFQVGANAGQTITVSITAANASVLGGTTASTALNGLAVTNRSYASMAIENIDKAIGQVDTIRGDLGAVQNRFESTIANLSNVSENLSAARSRILDADIAQETSDMTKYNILQQAGVSILAQANQAPQLALSLLG
jgi:flagellin